MQCSPLLPQGVLAFEKLARSVSMPEHIDTDLVRFFGVGWGRSGLKSDSLPYINSQEAVLSALPPDPL